MTRRALFIALLLTVATGAAGSELRVFELKYRTAEAMVPLVRPVIEGKVFGHEGKLIIRAEPAELEAAAELIRELDTPPQRIRITLKHTALDSRGRGGAGASGEVGPDRARGRVRIYSTREAGQDEGVQTIQTVAGSWARISAGKAVPIGYQVATDYGVQQGVEYVMATRELEVRAQVAGGEVALDVRPSSVEEAPEGGGRFDVQQLRTTIRGPLGEWIELGGTRERERTGESGTVYSTRDARESGYRTLVRVELLVQ